MGGGFASESVSRHQPDQGSAVIRALLAQGKDGADASNSETVQLPVPASIVFMFSQQQPTPLIVKPVIEINPHISQFCAQFRKRRFAVSRVGADPAC